MKSLFTIYPAAFQRINYGGGEVQLTKTKEYLQKSGVDVDLFNFRTDLKDYDVLHTFGINLEVFSLCETAKKLKVPRALSTIFWDPFKFHYFENGFVYAYGELMMRKIFKNVKGTIYKRINELLGFQDILLPNSYIEREQVKKSFNVKDARFHVVPNGVDASFYKADAGLFKKKFNLSDFVLFVGRIEKRKNLLRLIKAFNRSGIHKDLVVIGDVKDNNYYSSCLNEARNNKRVHFIKGLHHEDPLLKSAYAACDTFVLPSYYETPGLTALEAGLAGAKLIVTKEGSTMEYFKDNAAYFSPFSTKSIVAALRDSQYREKDSKVSKFILKNYTWDVVARETLKAYKKIV